jgi:ferritin-like metal-binding protein YciE
MKKLAEKNRSKLIDLLTERLFFERSSVKLYDTILAKMESSAEEEVVAMLDQMREHRNEEWQHEEFLEQCIRDLGGDTHAESEMARLTIRESQGIAQVVGDPSSPLSHLFHALLAWELVDNAGWDLLVELADEAGDRAAKRDFKKCLKEEEEHLIFVREAMERFARREVLGEPAEMPAEP